MIATSCGSRDRWRISAPGSERTWACDAGMATLAHAQSEPGRAGSSHRRPGRPLAASTGTPPDGDLQTSYAAPSQRSASGYVDRRHHAEQGTKIRENARRAADLSGRRPDSDEGAGRPDLGIMWPE